MLGVGLIGCGAIGTALAKAIDKGEAGSIRLLSVYDVDLNAAKRLVGKLRRKPKVVGSAEEICSDPRIDLVIEAASQQAVREFGEAILRAGKDLVVLSVGALADDALKRRLERAAAAHGRKIYIPSGAVVGIDGVRAASIDRIVLITRKPPRALARNPRVGREITRLKRSRIVFEGPAREAVRLFPASVNVAATLSLAGLGFDRTWVRIVADPKLKRNVHEIRVEGRAGRIVTVAENLPMRGTPGTSRLAALSIIRLLRNLSEPVYIGA
jgi:aspartate dehydrogenase